MNEVIAEEGEEEKEALSTQQQSGGGTIHTRLYGARRSIEKKRQALVYKGEKEKMNKCNFQPNVERVKERKDALKSKE